MVLRKESATPVPAFAFLYLHGHDLALGLVSLVVGLDGELRQVGDHLFVARDLVPEQNCLRRCLNLFDKERGLVKEAHLTGCSLNIVFFP